MTGEFKITITAEDEAMFTFDFENHVEPVRTTAKRIAAKYGVDHTHPLVDEIHQAIEDAMDAGRRRAPLEIESINSHTIGRMRRALEAINSDIKPKLCASELELIVWWGRQVDRLQAIAAAALTNSNIIEKGQ